MVETEIKHLPENTLFAEEDQNRDDEGAKDNLKCLDCDVLFTSDFYLHNHLLHHIKQPIINLERVKTAVAPIKITFKSLSDNNFEIVSSPTTVSDTSDSLCERNENNNRSSSSCSVDKSDIENNATAHLGAASPSIDDNAAEYPTPDDIDNQSDYLSDFDEQLIVHPSDDMEETTTVQEDDAPNYAEDDAAAALMPDVSSIAEGVTIEEIAEIAEIAGIAGDDTPLIATNDETQIADENEPIPGAEPTPPPEPELPKIRIKTSGLLKERTSTNAILSKSHQDDLLKGLSNSSILSNLFTNNDRAKDLGFTTSDPDFGSNHELQLHGSSALSDALNSLPMQQLAEQVSRLQPNASNSLHQQNVLINIQQFPQAPPTHPPQPHGYHPHMFPPRGPPPPPPHMYPYQYRPEPLYYGGGRYFPMPGPAPHMPPPQGPHMPPQGPHMPPQGPHMPPQRPHMPPPHMQPVPSVSMPQSVPNDGSRMQPPMQRPPMSNIRPWNGGQRPMQPPQAPSKPGPRQLISKIRSTIRGRPPLIRPMQTIMQPTVQNGAPRMPVKRTPVGTSAIQIKKKRIDVLVPNKHDDADCQVISVQPTNTGLPQIQSIEGNVSESRAAGFNLPESITLSIKTPKPTATPPTSEKSEASEVANILATRGITVTTAPKLTKPPTQKPPEPPTPVAINLNSAVSIIPTKHQLSASGKNENEKPLPTVDLTEEQVEVKPMKPPPMIPPHTSKVLPFQCDLCPAKYPNAQNLNKHRRSFHKITTAVEYAIPLVDLKSPGVINKLTNLGITSYIPYISGNKDDTFALPIISVQNKEAYLTALGADQILPIGPIRNLTNS